MTYWAWDPLGWRLTVLAASDAEAAEKLIQSIT